jgi:hypothetical protein
MGINYESTPIGDVRAVQLSAAPSIGGSLLRFTLIWSMHPKRDQVFSVFGTYVRISVGAERTPESLYLGHALPEVAWSDESRLGSPVDRPLMYLLSLEAHQLLVLEQMRASGGLHFRLDVRGNAHGPFGIRQIDSSLALTVSVSDWIRVLRESNAKDILLVGAAIPREAESPELAEALKLVRRAHEFLLRGEDNAAVGECRRALESVWKSRGLEQAARDARKALSTMDTRQAMGKRERQLAVGEALINFAHPAHHAGSSADFSRADAALAVAATAALISSLGLQGDFAATQGTQP